MLFIQLNICFPNIVQTYEKHMFETYEKHMFQTYEKHVSNIS